MEEKKEDIIYDMASQAESLVEAGAPGDTELSEATEPAEEPEVSDNSEDSADTGSSETTETTETTDNITDNIEKPESSDNPDASEMSAAEREIERMVGEMGAETLLEIIRDNRNAAIRQIISEVEESRPRGLPSGASVARNCSSIFDLAALA